ncbi:mitochondrial carrier domain-containing protein [Pelagophyceae sp. CCMP2097]|nr:mitochondrial carrier domain-containing protein [Pelagophyceae sp. CCMP2097]
MAHLRIGCCRASWRRTRARWTTANSQTTPPSAAQRPRPASDHRRPHRRRRAVGGGASGALAGVAQVLSLMWLRTAMNYEPRPAYRYGGNGTLNTVKTLWDEGGLPRLYRGLSFALVQSPLSRFGDAAANAAVPTLISTFCLQAGESLTTPRIGFAAPPIVATQFAASLTASTWRIAITPLDSLKTALQVEGNLTRLQDRIKADGVPTLWRGALTAAAATFVGNYPWFLTYNALDAALPTAEGYPPVVVLGRRALLGVCASCTSDVASNSLRVVKTGVQTADDSSSPLDVAKQVWAAEGPQGLFGRGLQTRLTVNCIQGAVFSVFWKYFEGVLLPKS